MTWVPSIEGRPVLNSTLKQGTLTEIGSEGSTSFGNFVLEGLGESLVHRVHTLTRIYVSHRKGCHDPLVFSTTRFSRWTQTQRPLVRVELDVSSKSFYGYLDHTFRHRSGTPRSVSVSVSLDLLLWESWYEPIVSIPIVNGTERVPL